VLEVSTFYVILAENKLLTHKMTELMQKLGNIQAKAVNTTYLLCDFYGRMHQNGECQVTQQEARRM